MNLNIKWRDSIAVLKSLFKKSSYLIYMHYVYVCMYVCMYMCMYGSYLCFLIFNYEALLLDTQECIKIE